MPQVKSRRFTREFKLLALSRMDAGENLSALSRELKVRRKLLYEWRDAFRAGGEAALRPPGRPPRGARVVGARTRGGGAAVARPPGGRPGEPPDDLAAARRRIADLERKVGRQALEISRRPRVRP